MTKITTGEPVDDLDKLCKEYRDCLRCAMKDNQDAFKSGGCEASATGYKWQNALNSAQQNGAADGEICSYFTDQKNNKNNKCRQAICECDVMFAMSK